MNKMTKRILSFILMFALCASTVLSGTVSAFADEEISAPEVGEDGEQNPDNGSDESGDQTGVIDGTIGSDNGDEDQTLPTDNEDDLADDEGLAAQSEGDDNLFVLNAISGATQKDVMVNGERRVVYCMQYDNLWPTPDGGGYHNAPTKYWEASAEEMLLTEDQLAIIQRLLYAGYPYDAVGALEPLYTQIPMDADYYASELTQNVLWSYMAKWGVLANSHYSNEKFDLSDLPGGQESYEALVDYAENGGTMASIPADFTPEISGDLSFHEGLDSFATGALTITNPVGFKVMYYVTMPDDVTPYDEYGCEIWPHYGMVNGEFTVIGYPIYGGETFYLYTNQPGKVAGKEITVAGTVKVPTDVKQYMTNDTGKGDKNDGQGMVQHPYQTMLSVGVISKDFTGTATFPASETEVKVTKVWVDGNDQDGLRPNYVYVYLYADKEYTGEEVILDAANNWTDAFSGLARYNADGEEIVYTVMEKAVDGYTASYSDLTADGITITNTHTPAMIDVHVTKTWVGDDGVTGKRPAEITVVLLANNELTGTTVTLNANNRWEAWIEGLPKYENGNAINYTIEEIGVREYASVITGDQDTGFAITNTYTPNKIEIPVTKIWEDNNNQDGKRPQTITIVLYANEEPTDTTLVLSAANNWEGAFKELDEYDSENELIVYSVKEATVDYYDSKVTSLGNDPANGYIITNSYTPATITIPVEKVWVGDDDAIGKRPAEITVVLLANNDYAGKTVTLNADNEWSAEFTNLPVYENGAVINYTIEEIGVREYESVITGDQSEGFTVTNTYTPGLIEVPVTKIWEDNNNQDGKRPESITVVLWKNGEPTDTTLVLSAANNWEGAFKDLEEYDEQFNLIDYYVEEVAVDEYLSEVTEITDDPANGFVITNYYTPGKVEVSVTKIWVDNNDQDGMRADEVTITLRADGVETEHKLILSERNHWTGKFVDLDEYKDGKKIFYEVLEHGVSGYLDEYSIIGMKVDDYEGGAVDWNITNTHEPHKISIPVGKIWDDNDDQDGVRPERIYVSLYADGEEIVVVELNEQNGWKREFTDLDEFRNGHKIIYTVREAEANTGELDPYTGNVQGSAHSGFRFINTHEPSKIDINVEKIWDDEDDQDGLRPESITLILKVGDEEIDELILTEDNNWKGAFENLDEYKKGEKIEYSIKEVKVDGYETLIDETGYIITNKHVASKISIPVEKVWNDEDDKDKIRPDEVVVVLLANGKETGDTLKLNKANGWKGEFTDLYEFNAGIRVEYTIKEVEVEGYTTKISGDVKDGFTITNIHTPKKEESSDSKTEESSKPSEESSKPDDSANTSKPTEESSVNNANNNNSTTTPSKDGKPDTGDRSQVEAYLVMLMASMMGVVVSMMLYKKERKLRKSK